MVDRTDCQIDQKERLDKKFSSKFGAEEVFVLSRDVQIFSKILSKTPKSPTKQFQKSENSI